MSPTEIAVQFTSQQLELLSRLGTEWKLSQEETIERLLDLAYSEAEEWSVTGGGREEG